ncbi:hypothetical protein LVJ94_10655 [Pendulispora rubella]|uniref:Uncharacterized protein n=1 Tax=Pendulispora rubella TaxID=2741070 RepID=A0ABZ2LES6_9BACT
MSTASVRANPGNGQIARARLVISWLLVGIPLAYGVYETLLKASKLFTG